MHLLGTGGTFPLPERHLSALLIKYKRHQILFDCGEGTQVAIRSFHLGLKNIDAICITHFHADHILGLPGLLLTIGNAGREEPVTIIGPTGIAEVVKSLCITCPIPFPLKFQTIEGDFQAGIYSVDELSIDAQFAQHRATCYAYRVRLNRAGKFKPEKAKELGVPLPYWKDLQQGKAIVVDGKEILSEEVLGPARRGIQLCFATDLRPSTEIVQFAMDSDLFVCESHFGRPEEKDKAILKQHCTFSETAKMAKDAHVKELWLTHYGTAIEDPEEYLPYAQEIFPNTKVYQTSTTLTFED